VNGQPAATQDIVYKYSFAKLTGTMHEVTQVMVDQTSAELGLTAPPATAPDKSVELKVNTLLSKYGFFSWSSKLQFEARLGDGTVITKDVKHASGVLIQDLNGCIAEAGDDPAQRSAGAHLSRGAGGGRGGAAGGGSRGGHGRSGSRVRRRGRAAPAPAAENKQ
jgi:uncharacterized membrane protein YgcG